MGPNPAIGKERNFDFLLENVSRSTLRCVYPSFPLRLEPETALAVCCTLPMSHIIHIKYYVKELTAEHESVPPDGGVGDEPLDAGPVQGRPLVRGQLAELTPRAGQPLPHAGVGAPTGGGQAELRH